VKGMLKIFRLSWLKIIFLLATLCLVISLLPINWEKGLAQKLFSYQISAKVMNIVLAKMKLIYPSSSRGEFVNYLVENIRMLTLFMSLCFFLIIIFTKFFKLSLNQILPYKSKLLKSIFAIHLIIFCSVVSWWLRYINHYIHSYYGKSNEEIIQTGNNPLQANILSFVHRCRKEIPEDANVLLLIKGKPRARSYFHLNLNYLLYPRKIYIHFPLASSSSLTQQEEWVHEYMSSGISLESIDIESLKHKDIHWIIAYSDERYFPLEKAEIITIEELIEQRKVVAK
jgi:hypothetical protein